MHGLLKSRQFALYPFRQAGNIRSRFTLHHRYRTLTKFGIIQRNNEDLADVRMGRDNPLKTLRLNALASAEKEVIHPTEDRQATVMQFAAIAGGKPAL